MQSTPSDNGQNQSKSAVKSSNKKSPPCLLTPCCKKGFKNRLNDCTACEEEKEKEVP